MSAPPMVRAEHLHRFFHAGDEEVQALRDLSIDVNAGELVAVVGPSGSGKSTLMACVCGLDDPDGGTVWLNGVRLSRQSETERSRRRAESVGILLQAENLIAHLSVGDNIALAQRIARRDDRARRMDLLRRLEITSRAAALPAQLSGGERARAGLAVALANGPQLLVADEPTGEVDSVTETDVVDLLRAEVDSGVAALVVTHSAALASRADRVVRLLDGRVTT